MPGRAQLSSGPGDWHRWLGGDTTALRNFAGDRWIGVNEDGLPVIRASDGDPAAPMKPGWVAFRPDGQDWVIVVAADVWDAWVQEAA